MKLNAVVWSGENELGEEIRIYAASTDSSHWQVYTCSRELAVTPEDPTIFHTVEEWQRHVREAHFRPGEPQPQF